MSESTSQQIKQQLREAYDQIKAGQNDAARALLYAAIRSDADNAETWWLIALTARTPAEKRDALQKVLRLKPDHIGAREMLDAGLTLAEIVKQPAYQPPYLLADDGELPMRSEPSPRKKKKRSPRRWPFLIALFIMASAFAMLGFIVVYNNIQLDTAAGHLKATQLAMQQALVNVPDTLPVAATRMLELDQTLQHGTLKALEQQVWSYVSTGAEKVSIRVTALSDNFQPLIGLYDEHGTLIAHPTDRTGNEKTLVYQLSTAGTYSVLVGNIGGAAGDYVISLMPDVSTAVLK